MQKQLRPEDANAVDLLLNSNHGHDGKPLMSTFVHHSNGAGAGRIQSVETVFKLLDQMPVIEPSRDLVAMTLARIDEAVYGGAPGAAIRPTSDKLAGSSDQTNA